MFHSGFSGARQALSAILLNSSESLPRADRDGGPGASPAFPAHMLSLCPQRGLRSLSHPPRAAGTLLLCLLPAHS